MHQVAILALDGVIPMDLAAPIEVFGRTVLPSGAPAYRISVCGPDEEVASGPLRVKLPDGLGRLVRADTIVIPGVDDLERPIPPSVLAALVEAAGRGTRIASLCVGAFTLAATGLLDGMRATTHWAAADLLAHRHPAVTVDPAVLYVDNGQLLTSAGAAAAMDLCLHIVHRDYGSAVAARTARLSVTPLERAGGQAQYIDHPPPSPDGTTLAPLIVWMEDRLGDDLDLARLAAQAAVSVRTLNRRFRDQVGTSPQQWVQRARIRRAQHLLETTDHTIDRIACDVGLPAPSTFRASFRSLVGTSPQQYRAQFRTPRR